MLIIVESPAKAKTITRFVGKEHTVKASVGHVRGLSSDSKTKDGRKLEIKGIDIDNHFAPIYKIDPEKAKVVAELKKLAKKEDGILFATDSDREGEAISWHLAEILGFKDKSKVKRLEFHEITESAIKKAMANPRDLNQELVHAQQARQVLDKLVGFKLSPLLWQVMNNYKLSAGRVQSPALHLICLREDEIEAFKAQEYWEIYANFGPKVTSTAKKLIYLEEEKHEAIHKIIENSLRLTSIKGKKIPKVIDSKQTLDSLLDGIDSYTKFKVSEVKIKKEYSRTRPPFITSTLQQSASSAFGFSPKQTMQLAQRLYEGVSVNGQSTALITYMRTDSVNLSKESIAAARKYIQSKHPESLPDSPKFYKSKSRNAQEAHEAIRPTDPSRTPNSLKGQIDRNQWKLYDLIWKRTIASQMTDEERERANFELVNDRQDAFSGSVGWTIKPGFKAVTGEEILSKPDLKYQEGEIQYLDEILEFQKFTKPPSRYSPASLIKKLEELGIGRPSTYANIISTIRERNYVEADKSSLMPTLLGRQINRILSENFDEVTSSDLTSKLEDSLDHISLGQTTYEKVLDDFWYAFKEHVESVQAEVVKNKTEYNSAQTEEKCPICGGEMLIKNGRFGEYFQCQTDKSHMLALNYKEYDAALANAIEEYGDQTEGKKCAECSKSLVVKVSKKGLSPYIACPEYRVGNKHTVESISYGPCPKCKEEGRKGKKAGQLVRKRAFRGKAFIGCSLDKKVCGYVQKD